MSWGTPTNRSNGDFLTAAIWNQDVVANPIALAATGLKFLVDGGGATITTGIKMDLVVLAKADLNSVTLLADQSGSIVLDLWLAAYASFPPVVGNSICASAKPTITTATKFQDSTLTGWDKTWNEGEIIRVNVDSATTIQRVTCALDLVYT